MMTPKYNFLLPAYKPDFFKEALDSILGQTYRDFKLIILDDCSPYDLKSIVDEYDDDRITYYRNEENMGGKSLVACWNKLLGLADSEYIILASDDDVYEVNFLEEMDRLARKYPEVDLLRARCQMYNKKNNIAFYDGIYQELTDSLEFVYLMYRHDSIKCIANYVFKLSALKGIGGFIDFPLAWFSDRATVMKLSKNGVANSKDVLFMFRMSDVNITFGKNDEKKAYIKEYATRLYDKWFKDFIAPFEKQEPKMTAYQKGMLASAVGTHNELMKTELVRYLPTLSFKHFWEYVRLLDERMYRLYCFLVYVRERVKGFL